jgi:uncharacterized membrane protein
MKWGFQENILLQNKQLTIPIMKADAPTKKTIIAFFETQAQSETAIVKLSENGFDMQSLSIIAMDLCAVETIKGYYTLLDRMKKWAKIGAVYGAFWGLLFGANVFTIPFIGHLIIAGPLTVIVITIASAGAVGILSAFAAVLSGFIFPGKQHLKYNTEVKAGKYALLGQSDEKMIDKAREILKIRLSKKPLPTECDHTKNKEDEIADEQSGIIHLKL